MGKKLIRLRDVKFPPPIINLEVGLIAHALRSGLDVLVNALAERNGHVAQKIFGSRLAGVTPIS
jgi:hypothetical protein